MMWHHWHAGAIIAPVLLLLIMAVVILGIVALVRHGRSRSAASKNDGALFHLPHNTLLAKGATYER